MFPSISVPAVQAQCHPFYARALRNRTCSQHLIEMQAISHVHSLVCNFPIAHRKTCLVWKGWTEGGTELRIDKEKKCNLHHSIFKSSSWSSPSEDVLSMATEQRPLDKNKLKPAIWVASSASGSNDFYLFGQQAHKAHVLMCVSF